MREILEPRSFPEKKQQEQSEETYWRSVDSFLAITEGAKQEPTLQIIVERLRRHIDDYLMRINAYVRIHERMRKTNDFDDVKSTRAGEARQEAHNYVIEDINELYEKFQAQGLDTSWRQAISSADNLASDEHRAEVTEWATQVEKYLMRKNENRAA